MTYLAFFISICAFVWVRLCEPDELFGWFPPIVDKLKLPKKPLYSCEKCVAGQIAFWYCLYFLIQGEMQPHEAIQVIVYSIFFAYLLNRIDNL